ncbi:hypothetical protein JCM30237_07480 [Halolamina litorea]
MEPRRIRSLAVTREDAVAAYEARERGRKPTVLRVVAPLSGRMRARLHVATEAPGPNELHLHPATFVADPPPFPEVDETEDELRECGEYDLDRHRAAHERAVAEWRETVSAQLRERITLPPTDDADEGHEVTVSYLG